jgi:uncharacterized lipoprotein YehR (DUF1307 family)
MKKLIKLFGIVALVAIIGFSMVACDPEKDSNSGNNNSGGSTGGLSGTWRGTVQGMTVTVTITASGWTFTAPGLSDT